MSNITTVRSSDSRRWDLDWLRVSAFGLLIYFHAAVVFLPSGIPMIQKEVSSPALQVFVTFLHQFRLANESLLNRAEALRWASLVLANACTLMLFTQFYAGGDFTASARGPAGPLDYLWFCLLCVANVWFWLMACLGFAGRHLRRRHPALHISQ